MMMGKRARFEITIRPDGTAFWHLAAPNGEVLCHSEAYADAQAARKGIASVRRNALIAGQSEHNLKIQGLVGI